MIELVGSRKEQLELINPSKPVDTQYFYDEGYKAGVNSVMDYTKYATTINKIRRDLITEKEITITLPNTTDISNLFDISTYENKYVEHITVNCPNQVLRASAMFFAYSPSDKVLKHITINVDLSKVTSHINLFRGCQALEIIDGTPLDFSSAAGTTINIFNDCSSLREFRVAKESIKLNFNVNYFKNLSAETVESLIAGLADLTGGTAQTITFNKEVGNKLTDEQREAIAAKNWTLAY